MSARRFITRARDTLVGVPLLVKVMGIILAMTGLLCIALIWRLEGDYLRLERSEVAGDARLIANVLAVGSQLLLSQSNRVELQGLLEDVARAVPSVNTIEVRDGRDRLVAHLPPVDSKAQMIEATVAAAGDPPGRVSVALDDSHVNFEIGRHKRQILATTAIVGLVGLFATWRLMRLVTRPVHALIEVTRTIKAGNYQARAPVQARDELGELAEAFNDMMGALQQEQAVSHQLARKLLEQEEKVQKHVARELHDQTGQSLTALIAGLAAMRNGGHTAQLDDLLALATQTLGEIHDLSLTLRPCALDELGLMPALQKLGEFSAQRLGLTVHVAGIGFEGKARLPNEIEMALYRISQEALTNAVRHGQARSVEILLQLRVASVLAVIEDDGQGFDTQDWRQRCLRGHHLGLLGMEERTTLLGGTHRVESRPGGGTSLHVEIPLAEVRCV